MPKEPHGVKAKNTFMLGQSICLSWCMLACLLPSCCCLLPSSSCLLPSCSCLLPSRFPLPSQAICCPLPSFSLSTWSCTVTYKIGTKNICGFLEKRSHENFSYLRKGLRKTSLFLHPLLKKISLKVTLILRPSCQDIVASVAIMLCCVCKTFINKFFRK